MPISSLTLETQNQEHQVIYSQDSKLDTLKEENVFAVYIYCTKKIYKRTKRNWNRSNDYDVLNRLEPVTEQI